MSCRVDVFEFTIVQEEDPVSDFRSDNKTSPSVNLADQLDPHSIQPFLTLFCLEGYFVTLLNFIL